MELRLTLMSSACGFLPELLLDLVDYIYYIVADLFKRADNIHIVNAGLILIVVFVDVLDVGHTELVAEIVDFTFVVIGRYDFRLVCCLEVAQEQQHIGHCRLYGYEHGVDVMGYFLIEVYMAFLLADEYLGHAIAAVGYAFDFADDAQHCGYAVFAFV